MTYLRAGAVEGMGMGLNTTAMLVTRGCKEMGRLAAAMGAQSATLKYVMCLLLGLRIAEESASARGIL